MTMAAKLDAPGTPHVRKATRGQRWLVLAAAALAALGCSALSSWAENHLFVINASASLPNWAFWVDRSGRSERGSHVAFLPRSNSVVTAHFGAKPPMFVKLVYGVAGDRVSRKGRRIFLNDRAVGLAKPVSRKGIALTPVSAGIVPDACFYVGTPHPDSFDSRYAEIGLVCGDRIVGTARPVL